MKYRASVWTLMCVMSLCGYSDDFLKEYETFKQKVLCDYESFRDESNRRYADFLRNAWKRYKEETPQSAPKEGNPIPPMPYEEKEDTPEPIIIEPQPVPIEDVTPQPKPVEPIREVPTEEDDRFFKMSFYGVACRVRLPEFAANCINGCSPESVARGWERLSSNEMNNAIRDCLETRLRYNLCDWAYLQFLETLGNEFCGDHNSATLLTAYLFGQSGYQMRLGADDNGLILLYGSRDHIFEKSYYVIEGECFYPLGDVMGGIEICAAPYPGEMPMSLSIMSEQKLGDSMSDEREIMSSRYPEVNARAVVPTNLIKFFDGYPTSAVGGNPLSRWAMYAETPIAASTKALLYPKLKESIANCSKVDATNRLLNWVQTGFVYEYDEKVWGHDRAFFAEETLFYPYCDCEDRSIIFSHIVRDLLDLDVALIYYPGHLATAVKFTDDVEGNAMIIEGERYVVCDPTYIGAPVGAQMPGLSCDNAQYIKLKR